MTTASVAWPVTAGAAIDWDVPEIWDPSRPPAPEPFYVARFMNPVLAFEILTALGLPKAGERYDELTSRLAAYILTKHKPDLTLVHLIDLDRTQHAFGPGSPQAVETLDRTDEHIRAILAAVKQAGFAGRTDVFIVSDHGFMTVDRVIRPNTLLVKAGLLTASDNGTVTGGKIDTVENGGSFFIYWPRNENLRPAIDQALKPLLDRKLVWAILGPEALRDLGADPGARLALEAPRHAEFGRAGRGALVSHESGGEHGYLPSRKGLAASFIAWGPDIKPGVDLHEVPMTAVGPTILKAMGIVDPKFGDRSPLNDIWKAPAAHERGHGIPP
jgi:predicted AlkP superfamily pyrophosphatase or phosphodiesterase